MSDKVLMVTVCATEYIEQCGDAACVTIKTGYFSTVSAYSMFNIFHIAIAPFVEYCNGFKGWQAAI